MDALADNESDGILARVRKGHRQAIDSQAFGADTGRSVQLDRRRPAFWSDDLDVPPPDTVNARAKGLHGGLFCREPAGKLWSAATAVGQLPLGVYAPEESLTVSLDDAADTRYLDYVNACNQHLFPDRPGHASGRLQRAAAGYGQFSDIIVGVMWE